MLSARLIFRLLTVRRCKIILEESVPVNGVAVFWEERP